MSYRNPRFSYIHSMRDRGDDGFDATTEGTFPFRSDTPRTRWLDGLNGDLAGKADALVETHYARSDQTGESIPLISARRYLIPSTHNFGMDRGIEVRLSEPYPTPVWEFPLHVNISGGLGEDIRVIHPSSSLIDIEFDTADDGLLHARAYSLKWWQGFGGLLPDIGEVWWTNVYEPTTGPAYGWEDEIEGTYLTSEMESGAEFDTVKGEPKRTFTLRHEAIYGADLKMYDELRRRTLHGAGAFWYDHTDSGGKVIDVFKADQTGQLVLSSGCSESLITDGAPDGETDCIQILTDNTGGQENLSFDMGDWLAGTPTDWRNHVLQFDFKPVGSYAWIAAHGDFDMQLLDPGFDYFSEYHTWHQFVNSAAATDVWYRISVDLEKDVGTGSNLDLSTPGFTRLLFDNNSVNTFQIANFRLIDKTKQPVYVRMVRDSWRRTQESRAPGGAGGPRYNIEFEMIEVTT